MSVTIAILALIFIAFFEWAYEQKQTKKAKDELILKLREKHLIMRKEMNQNISFFNKEYTSWLYFKWISDKTPMSLIYMTQYKDMQKYCNDWRINFEKACLDETKAIRACDNRKKLFPFEEKLLTS